MTKTTFGHFAAVLLLAFPAAVHAQGKPAVVLSPASPWNVNYADDSCRLGRMFAEGAGQAAFLVDQFEPGPVMNVLVASKSFRGYAGNKVSARFGPSGAERTIDRVIDASFGTVGPAIMVNGVALVENATVTPGDVAADGTGADAGDGAILIEPKEATPEQAQAITWFEVQRGSRAPIRFAVGPMREPLAALRACTEELLTHWGIDVAAHRTLSKRPTPKGNPGSWVSSDDYPAHLAARGVQGIIQFRLIIDTDGKVSGCHIQQSTRPAEFDKKVCDIMTKRARFEPALDAQGRPIKSYWRSTFRFAMP